MTKILCQPCEKMLNTIALTKLWKDIDSPLLCEKCLPLYNAHKVIKKPKVNKNPPMRRCFLCRKRKLAYKFFNMKDGERLPSCKKCAAVYEEIRENQE